MRVRSFPTFKYDFRAPRTRVEGPIRFAVGQTLQGMVLVGRSQRGICAIFLGKDAPALLDQLAEAFPNIELRADESAFPRELNQVIAFIGRGQSEGGVINLDIGGTTFQQGVWRVLCGIPAQYSTEEGFRARIVMARHGFGRGEYKYFIYPLPPLLNWLRHAPYPQLVPIANRWNRQLGIDTRYPDELDVFLDQCHQAGPTRLTPLMPQYGEGDYNCLHQDLYGERVFPLQVAILLSEPGRDFAGGEFVMTEFSTKRQRADVAALRQGDAVVFTGNKRPATGLRAIKKVAMRHGVSRIRSGKRNTVGLIFHDSR